LQSPSACEYGAHPDIIEHLLQGGAVPTLSAACMAVFCATDINEKAHTMLAPDVVDKLRDHSNAVLSRTLLLLQAARSDRPSPGSGHKANGELFIEGEGRSSGGRGGGEDGGAPDGDTLEGRLCRACACGDTTQVAGLLKQGASPNATDSDGQSALLLSVWSGQDDENSCLRLLLDAKADPSGAVPAAEVGEAPASAPPPWAGSLTG